MPEVSCSACGLPLDGNAFRAGYCANCGPNAICWGPEHFIAQGFDLREIARRQRILLWGILSCFALLFALPLLMALERTLPPALQYVFRIANLLMVTIWVCFIIISALRLQSALGDHIVIRILTCFLFLMPCLNLLVLIVLNVEATRMLRAAGFRLGWMGVSDKEIMRQLATDQCRGCGYLLIGNTSGICPECGLAILPAQLGNIPTGADHV